ncbi:MAG: magnesium transporter [Bacteroidetes bacterium]|jgi:magnesium transporter|nr:magnesium transporter [Bacteroidota bacterium]
MPHPPAAKVDPEERPGGLLEVDGELVENIATLLRAQQQGMVLNLVADLYPADLARLLSHLPFDEARRLFRWMPPEQGSDVLAELDSAFRADLLEEERPQRLTALLDDLDTDDAADVLADLSDEVALRILPDLEYADDLRELLGYGEETAGGIMAREYVAVPIDWTVADVTEEVRRNAETVEEIYAVFVIDEAETLQGVITLKRLLLSQADARIDSVMNEDFISVTTDVDQEEVARIMERYDLVSLPVVDGIGRLVGRITIDDVVDVIRDEAEEDIQRMSGMSGDEEPTDSVLRITRGRLPWLLLGLVGAGLSGLVIGSFEDALEQAVVLATFIPIVMAMAGNAGIQSSSIVVQGLASGDVWASDVWRRLGKEVLVASINGVALAVLLAAFVLIAALGLDTARLALTAGLSLFLVILLATCIGTTVPLFLHRFDIDPALATGPFITTSNDIIGLAVFFLLATLLYL